ncbi:MAG: PKD domain-containing protein [Bacteroidia bacterium]|nr:PKD domain-containing protein [Bacteroidia bacterium]
MKTKHNSSLKSVRFFAVLSLLFVLQSQRSLSQCAANFTYNIGANGQVTFISTSTGTSATTNYNWNFGPATFSATGAGGMNPSYTYTANGVYMAYLNLYSAVPTCSSNTNGVWINITNATNTCVLNAGFTYGINQNNSVFFNNTSSGVSAGVTYTWNFGDGNSATGFQASHTYSSNGLYTVTLTANNNYTSACVSTYTAVVSASTACNFSANITSSVGANGVVSFSSNTSGSVIPNFYGWSFGDNTSVNGSSVLATVTHTYYSNGYFPISLWLGSQSPSCNVQFTSGVTVNNAPTPNCTLQANFTYTLGANGFVSFINTSTGTVAQTTYSWNFGTGMSWLNYNPYASSPNNQFLNNQTYLVTLTASNNFTPSCISTHTALVTISNTTCNLVPGLSFSLQPGGMVSFTNTTTGGNPSSMYYWDFGDGSPSPTINPISTQHTYMANGVYQVLGSILSTGPSCTATAAQNITITTAGGPPCNLLSSFSSSVGAAGLVTFTNTSTGTNTNTSYLWNFGDGNTSSALSPYHTYSTTGNFVVSLSLSDITNTFCVNSSTQMVNVPTPTCLANSSFSMAPTNTAQVWYASPSFPLNVSNAEWSWGDGSSSNQLYTSHTYSAPGLYTICLSVTVNCNATSSTCSTYSITKVSESALIVQVIVVPPDFNPVGIELQNRNALLFEVFPNPGDGLFQLQGNIQSEEPLDIQVLDLNGKCLYSEIQSYEPKQEIREINLKHLPQGLYILHLEQAGLRLNKKLVISKE